MTSIPEAATTATRGLIRRMAPVTADEFGLEIIPRTEDGLDVFEIESVQGGVVLRGNNGVSLASAFNRYLQDFCGCQVSWCGDQLALPAAADDGVLLRGWTPSRPDAACGTNLAPPLNRQPPSAAPGRR